jgi:hypothetical protein
VLSDGRVAYAAERVLVDEEFVTAAQEGRPAESRFRFSSPCVRGACRQWTGDRCGVIDDVLAAVGGDAGSPVPGPGELPNCSIRPTCRWFAQAGAEACAVCLRVITDASTRPWQVSSERLADSPL